MNAPRLITEWTNFEYDPNLIKEQKSMGKPMMMKGVLQKAETLNQNGRVYPKIILERENNTISVSNYYKMLHDITSNDKTIEANIILLNSYLQNKINYLELYIMMVEELEREIQSILK